MVGLRSLGPPVSLFSNIYDSKFSNTKFTSNLIMYFWEDKIDMILQIGVQYCLSQRTGSKAPCNPTNAPSDMDS